MISSLRSKSESRFKIGPVGRKVLLLLGAGIALELTQRPDQYFRILRSVHREWQKINNRSLHENIKKLYRSKMIDYKENDDGIVSMTLVENGKKQILRYNLEEMKIKRPAKWDKLWRVVIFDVPESFRQGRDALALKLKQLGFYPLQKSVFIHPYECKKEVYFIVEIFDLRPYVRFMTVKETDIDLDLKYRFKLL